MNQGRPVYGLVLAGGRSTRMGADKAAMTHPDGRPLARRAVDLLAGAGCCKVMVSLRYEQEVPPRIAELSDVEVVRDPETESNGPLTGMIAAMRMHPEADWLVLACDLPRLDRRTLVHLLESRRTDEWFLAYRSEFDGLPEPLCAFYAAGARPVLEQAMNDGFCCPRKVLIRNQCRLLDLPVPRALENANTPEDWKNTQ